eukprot:CAMPEP_0178978274 /NCGR_PEP_ID=MMETSP0789-20121207/25051_1 /TAXON_ID=3005 /ORGANISM="Rhizosolenia setigera, Strain CCMP 1694" /LENGTH=310 /DNA_ID=CAMNT_0020667961 /DNA_START=31 /DNA_END=963 /DNA_ORIENTATION=-
MSSLTKSSPFKSDCLGKKTALITGGGSGICFEITKQLLLHGCGSVVICGRRKEFLEKAASTLNSLNHQGTCYYYKCDVRYPDQCKSAVEYAVSISKNKKIDILVNGAAGNFLATAEGLKPKGFRTVMEIDTMGTFNMCNAAHPYMVKERTSTSSETSAIINISATLQYGATWFQSHASAAKAAVDSLTRSLALEWGEDNIRVNGIAPGPIADTPGTTKLAPGMSSDDVDDMVSEGIPLGRMGQAYEIGMAAVFLSCDVSGGYVTGDTLVVDGGQWLWKPKMIDREMVQSFSRGIEKKSRDQAPSTIQSKL